MKQACINVEVNGKLVRTLPWSASNMSSVKLLLLNGMLVLNDNRTLSHGDVVTITKVTTETFELEVR